MRRVPIMNNRSVYAANSSMVGHGGGRNNCGRFDCKSGRDTHGRNLMVLSLTHATSNEKDQASGLDLNSCPSLVIRPSGYLSSPSICNDQCTHKNSLYRHKAYFCVSIVHLANETALYRTSNHVSHQPPIIRPLPLSCETAYRVCQNTYRPLCFSDRSLKQSWRHPRR